MNYLTHTPEEVLASMSNEEKAEAAEWLEKDSAYLLKAAASYRENGGDWYRILADTITENARHSARFAQMHRDAIR